MGVQDSLSARMALECSKMPKHSMSGDKSTRKSSAFQIVARSIQINQTYQTSCSSSLDTASHHSTLAESSLPWMLSSASYQPSRMIYNEMLSDIKETLNALAFHSRTWINLYHAKIVMNAAELPIQSAVFWGHEHLAKGARLKHFT